MDRSAPVQCEAEDSETRASRPDEVRKRSHRVAIDVEKALSQLDGDRELLYEAIDIFIETLPECLWTFGRPCRPETLARLRALRTTLRERPPTSAPSRYGASHDDFEKMGQQRELTDSDPIIAELNDHFDCLVGFAEDLRRGLGEHLG